MRSGVWLGTMRQGHSDVFTKSQPVLPHCGIEGALFTSREGLVQVKQGLTGANF